MTLQSGAYGQMLCLNPSQLRAQQQWPLDSLSGLQSGGYGQVCLIPLQLRGTRLHLITLPLQQAAAFQQVARAL